MEFDTLLLSRLQFALTISFHILFTLTIGLALFLAVIEGLWLKTGKTVYRQLFRFWARVFALSFGLSVVFGVVLPYQFGTNFSRFSEVTGTLPLATVLTLLAVFAERWLFFVEAKQAVMLYHGSAHERPRQSTRTPDAMRGNVFASGSGRSQTTARSSSGNAKATRAISAD